MSNLGLYQTFTTIAKKAGGPGKLLLLIFGGGAAVGAGAMKGVEKLRKHGASKKEIAKEKIVIVTKEGTDNQGLTVKPGDKIKILEIDKDVVLIEVVGRDDNPFYVHADFLKEVSGEDIF